VVGTNKVAPDLDSAIARVKHYAAPVNAIRLGLPTPCVETGLCADCKSPQRICNIWTIIEGHMVKDRIHVKLVGENLGYSSTTQELLRPMAKVEGLILIEISLKKR
jgi:hypothetical protein